MHCGLRFGAGLKMLSQVKLVVNFKVFFKVKKGGLSYYLLLFFFKEYRLFLSLDKLSDLLSSKLNHLSPFGRRTNNINPCKPRIYGLDHVF